jgi:DHA2 family multidrug resistance protein
VGRDVQHRRLCVGTPLTGWLANRFGWRNVLFGAMVGFTISSLACGLSNTLTTLVIARFFQGFFGAAIMPMGQGILLATFRARSTRW